VRVIKVFIYSVIGYLLGGLVTHIICEVFDIQKWTTEAGPMLLRDDVAGMNIVFILIFMALGIWLALRDKKIETVK
jgi:ABC-type antimicrobial peptide transport system permease subunit